MKRYQHTSGHLDQNQFGQSHTRSRPKQGRLLLTLICFLSIFVIITVRLISLGVSSLPIGPVLATSQSVSKSQSRPDVVDRYGQLLSTDIKTSSLYSDPAKIIDMDELTEKLHGMFPELELEDLHVRLQNDKRRFEWIKRHLTPKQEAAIYELGLPSLNFIYEAHRVYPSANLASHILGFVDIDNKGLSGVERYLDQVTGVYLPKVFRQAEKPIVELSIDLGVQHILRDELAQAMKRYRAKAAGGILLDVTSGEVIAMSSLPDFNPHQPKQALEKDRLNRMVNGSFELGSIFKAITAAMALDYRTVGINSGYDATRPIRIGGFTINDYHPKKRWLSVPEIFIYSSNIGAAKMSIDVGKERHYEFLKRLNLTEKFDTELGDVSPPLLPKKWRNIHSITISYGHGISVSPLQFAASSAALFNGGYYVKPTFLKRSRANGRALATKVLRSSTSSHMRELMRQNVLRGTGKAADALGYRVGGKTGTAEKAINGKYDTDKLLTTFLSVFPSDDPAYLMLIMLDEPQTVAGQKRPTAGANVAPLTKRIIERVGAKLGVMPQFEAAQLPGDLIE
ncbi:MAG: penicillin-binding protein 2 [Pseudomonadota bacterium]